MPQCQGYKTNGQRCLNQAGQGQSRCHQHQLINGQQRQAQKGGSGWEPTDEAVANLTGTILTALPIPSRYLDVDVINNAIEPLVIGHLKDYHNEDYDLGDDKMKNVLNMLIKDGRLAMVLYNKIMEELYR